MSQGRLASLLGKAGNLPEKPWSCAIPQTPCAGSLPHSWSTKEWGTLIPTQEIRERKGGGTSLLQQQHIQVPVKHVNHLQELSRCQKPQLLSGLLPKAPGLLSHPRRHKAAARRALAAGLGRGGTSPLTGATSTLSPPSLATTPNPCSSSLCCPSLLLREGKMAKPSQWLFCGALKQGGEEKKPHLKQRHKVMFPEQKNHHS